MGGDGRGWESSLPGPTAAAGKSVGAASPREGGQESRGMPDPHHPHPELPVAGNGGAGSHSNTAQDEVSSWTGLLHVAPCHSQKPHQGLLLGRTPQLEPAGMRSIRRMAVPQFPLGTLQQERSVGDPSTHGGAAAAPQHGRATPAASPGACVCSGAVAGGGSGVAGAHPSPVTARKPENLIHSRRRQGLPKCPRAGVSGARGVGGAGDAGGARAELGVPMDAGAGEAQARMGLELSQPKKIWASLDGLGASPRLGGEALARHSHPGRAGGGRGRAALALPGGHRAPGEG